MKIDLIDETMSGLSRAHHPPSLERLCCEVNSRCSSLRAASRLLPDLSGRETDEMLLLMTEEALQLAKSIEEHQREASRPQGASI